MKMVYQYPKISFLASFALVILPQWFLQIFETRWSHQIYSVESIDDVEFQQFLMILDMYSSVWNCVCDGHFHACDKSLWFCSPFILLQLQQYLFMVFNLLLLFFLCVSSHSLSMIYRFCLVVTLYRLIRCTDSSDSKQIICRLKVN